MLYSIPLLPLNLDLESKHILKLSIAAHRKLAELKGVARTIPNEEILINTLVLQEAKDSSEVEGIVTTHDDLFQAAVNKDKIKKSKNIRDVMNYRDALKYGFKLVREDGLLTTNRIKEIQNILEPSYPDFRKSKVELKKENNGSIIYTPPESHIDVTEYMSNLEKFMNDDTLSDLDPLIKMAIIHHQFESIHPFLDGNGRTGRMINVLYLVMKGLLDIPILYLSRYINKNRAEYYELLKHVQDTNDWEKWVIFMLKSVEETADNTISLVKAISKLIYEYKPKIKEILGLKYSQELLNALFSHPYTSIYYLQMELEISKPTAIKYLELLSDTGFLQRAKIGKNTFYINIPLYILLSQQYK